ncbi:MAG TPA: DinB family protein [Methylomirabilota bacterium]|nr:DinB family protein [Methylomirabilota bacterium]
MTRRELLDVLRATPGRVAELARGLSPGQLAQPAAEGEWSMGQIVDHLLRGERDVILPRFRRMQREEAPVFPSSAADRTGFAAVPKSSDFTADLAAFRRVRGETLAFLGQLSEAEWRRLGSTPTRGTLSIEAYARYLADHDREHLAQMEAARIWVLG